MDHPLPVSHVFIDFENVHQIDPAVIGSRTISLTLLIGQKQTKLAAAFVEKLMEHAGWVQLVRLSSSGKNALDFALAYYVGRAVAADPGGCFHIISKDKGFDPLVAHLKSRNIRATRHEDLSTLPVSGVPGDQALNPAPAPPKSEKTDSVREDRMDKVLKFLQNPKKNRPKKHKKLLRALVSHLGNASDESQVSSLIGDLQKQRYLAVDENGAITYLASLK